MKRISLILSILLMATSMLFAGYEKTRALLPYEEDLIMLVDSAVYNKTGRRRTYQNIMQSVEYIHSTAEQTDLIAILYAPKDATGIAWLYSDTSTLYYDPVYDEFTEETFFPSYLMTVFPPDYAGFKVVSENESSIILSNDSYKIEYQLADGLPSGRTVTELSSGKIILSSSYSSYREIAENIFYPMMETRWSEHFNGVEIENTIQDIRIEELPESYFTEEFIRAKVN